MKPIFKTFIVIAMIFGLLLAASEQPSMLPNFAGIIIVGVGALIYRKLNN